MAMLMDGFESIDDMAAQFAGSTYYWDGYHEGAPRPKAFDADKIDVVVAVYEQGSYDGTAFVVFRDKADGKVYEVNASHCSCYGLEDQWKPEEIVAKELLARPVYLYGSGINELIRHKLTEELAA